MVLKSWPDLRGNALMLDGPTRLAVLRASTVLTFVWLDQWLRAFVYSRVLRRVSRKTAQCCLREKRYVPYGALPNTVQSLHQTQLSNYKES